MSVLSFSGGLVYHLRAALYRPLWRDFEKHLAEILCRLPVSQSQLTLIGPSAGYNVSNKFLNQFESVLAIDPDPLAPLLFEFQHHGLSINWQLRGVEWQASQLPDIWSNPDQLLLFANVLGQLGGTYGGDEFEKIKSSLRKKLSQCAYFSFHDLYSSREPFSQEIMGPRWDSLAPSAVKMANSPTRLTAVTDHLTWDLFDAQQPRIILQWQLTPKQFHLIECTWNLHRSPSNRRAVEWLLRPQQTDSFRRLAFS